MGTAEGYLGDRNLERVNDMEHKELNWAVIGCGVIANEMVTVLLKNSKGQMATVALSMHSKQPKRAMISCEKGYIEIMKYPREAW